MFDGPIRPIQPVRAISALRAVAIRRRPTGVQLRLVRLLGKRCAGHRKDDPPDDPDPPARPGVVA